MSSFPKFPKRAAVAVDGVWDFAFLPEACYSSPDLKSLVYGDRISVPGVWDALPAWLGKRGYGFHRTFVEIPSGVRARLTLGALGLYGKLFVDGVEVHEQRSPYVPFSVDLPRSERTRREIVVMACNVFDYERCPMVEPYFDFYAYGGIYRELSISLLPEGAAIDWVGVDAVDLAKGLIRISVEGSGLGGSELRILDASGTLVHKETRPFKGARESFELVWPDKRPWSPASPVLHTLTVESGDDAMTVRFGLRQVSASKGRVLVNGEPVRKLVGYCRHESHPQYGPALPLAQLVADLQILRDMGCNFVRGSHYPQDPRFLSLCDELGFLVWEESLGWGQKVKDFLSRDFIEQQLSHSRAMLKASYNNPSVVIRGFLNEGESCKEEARECYEALFKLFRSEDPSRLVTYATMFGLDDKFLELADIVSFNIYPGWYTSKVDDETPLGEIVPRIREIAEGLARRGLSDKPFIVSEIGAAAMYGWRDPICSQWSEQFQAEYLRIACEEIVSNPGVAGVSLWQLCDGRTYRGSRSLTRPRTFNNKGTLDEYRRPKMAYETVKGIFKGAMK